ncbi:LacI family DNA-binding transcriptional regulator [Cellulomonas shaoxiangyii]|uniref:LacI family transcriptional regulator n=1 Tax=Cellulomonas shaoxiangyii TaxID=2566013 RepID=A0A4P7SLT8_9CELL|nr:LacI family DNA-binding transcriptional regulator [Cellulomonas shaoxiangyii]QCB93543.1 LacI family transcriptional regulator [Cellulomonas shaoxiangyii]TGY86865.1 LacI family transcriptional regulator [Cellulomonas shaoxiangyii]
MRRPTLADVAAVAGVSAKTVSNVLLGRDGVSEATRQAVLAAVAEGGYEVNLAGRGLASGRTGRVAVVVPNVYQPYFAEIAERLILALEQHGFTTMLRIGHDEAAEREAVLGSRTRDVDGVIFCPHFVIQPGDTATPQRPVVQLGGGATSRWDCVVMGEREGAEAITRHLLETGRRRIALVWNAGHGGAPRDDRFAGHLAALAAYGVPHDPSLLVSGSDWDRRASGYEAMVALLRSGASFDAAMCVNDAIAAGALRALRRTGVRVPQDVAVTGFDNTDEGEFTVPALSSVSPQQEQMVASAVGMLLERMAGHTGPAREVRTGADLVVRASSAPRRP